jgi:hypothetical protein
MALTYLRVDPETAVTVLEECLDQGNQLKDRIEEEFRNISTQSEIIAITLGKISTWEQQATNWTSQCIKRLASVFTGTRQQYSFRDAPTYSALVIVDTTPIPRYAQRDDSEQAVKRATMP